MLGRHTDNPSSKREYREIIRLLRDIKDTLLLVLETDMEELHMAGELKAALADLQAKVAAEKTVEDGVVTLLDGIKAQLDALAGQAEITPADLAALSTQISTNTQAMADAVVRDTLAAGTPGTAPTP